MMEPVAIVTLLVLIEYFFFSIMVARARVQTGISPPTTSGDPIFERYFRVQQNTLEQLIVFLPALWLYGFYVESLSGAALGLVFIVGRFMYMRGYVKEPVRRAKGFIIGQLAATILLLGGLISAALAWFNGA